MIWRDPPLDKRKSKKVTDEPVLRADAQKNRELILSAAEELFLEKGAGVPLEEVAKRAGVGIGTLYRRFPTREALLAATSNERFLSLAQTSRARDPELTPGEAIRAYLEELSRNTGTYRSLAASIGTVIQCGTPGCNAITAEGQRLLQRGQEAGTIRRDVTYDDFIYVVTAIAIAVESDGSSKARIGHLVDLFLNGISVKGPA
jgi:AcrR family transcriptional regulator